MSSSPIRLSVVILCLLPILYYILGLNTSLQKDIHVSRRNGTTTGSNRTLRILCFGDSLTSGARPLSHHKKLTFHAYSKKLEKLLKNGLKLEKTLAGYSSVSVVNKGKPGELAVGSMKRRLIGLLKGNESYDLVIILGGTNDLGFLMKKPATASNVTTILKSLMDLHELCHYFKTRTLVVAIPPRLCELERTCLQTAARRKYLNIKLYHYASRNKRMSIFADLARYFESRNLFADFVHFTDYGYDKMADIFYYLIKERL